MKNIFLLISILIITTFLFWRCEKESDQDDEKPVINMEMSGSFPLPCDTLFKGDSFIFKAVFTDNVELGSFNLELHHNFDHHTHGSHVESCEMESIKEPVNPFYLNESFTIPTGLTSYNAQIEVPIPADADTGDYHFMVKLTDKEGWQAWQSVSVKVL